MKAPKWQRYREQLKKDAGKKGEVLGCTFTDGYWLALVKLLDKEVVVQAVSETAELNIGDKVQLVLRKGAETGRENPLQYRLKAQKYENC